VVSSLEDVLKVAAVNTPNSILNAMAHDVQRLSPISQSGSIMVEIVATNNTPNHLPELLWYAGIEKDGFSFRERWECCECFYGPLASACNEAGGGNGWSTEGGYFYNTVESPSLPACDNSVPFSSGACHDVFPAVNCNTPSYEVRYFEPGNGLWMPSGSIRGLRSGFTHYGYANTTFSAFIIIDGTTGNAGKQGSMALLSRGGNLHPNDTIYAD